jgi:hypothetical protein
MGQAPVSHAVDEMLDTMAASMSAKEIQRIEKDIDKKVDEIRDRMHQRAIQLLVKIEAEVGDIKLLRGLKNVLVEGYREEVEFDKKRDLLNVVGYRKTLLAIRNGRHTVGELEDIHLGVFKYHPEQKIKIALRPGRHNAKTKHMVGII